MYKLTDEGVFEEGKGLAVPGGYGWDKYQEWLAEGNTPEPQFTDEEIFESSLEKKLMELKTELESRMDSVKPKSNSKKDLKLVSRQLKLVLRKLEGRASEAEIAEVAASEELDDYLDDATDAYDVAEQWLEAPERTLGDIEAYDVMVDPSWPNVEGGN